MHRNDLLSIWLLSFGYNLQRRRCLRTPYHDNWSGRATNDIYYHRRPWPTDHPLGQAPTTTKLPDDVVVSKTTTDGSQGHVLLPPSTVDPPDSSEWPSGRQPPVTGDAVTTTLVGGETIISGNGNIILGTNTIPIPTGLTSPSTVTTHGVILTFRPSDRGPLATNQGPPTSDRGLPATGQEPTPSGPDSSSSDQEPTGTAKEPSGNANKPSATGQESRTTNQASSSTIKGPTATGQGPAATGHELRTTNQASSLTIKGPTATGQEPTGTDQEPHESSETGLINHRRSARVCNLAALTYCACYDFR